MTTTTRTPETRQEELFDASAHDPRVRSTRHSALWAAYGDALGFISELTSEKGLRARTGGEALDRLLPWRRRVGGRGGVSVQLPAGCWSDDTQLRMAVSRAISDRGFDAEAFARIELPVWPSYALGGGRASKAAAKNLGKPTTLWHANTFPGWFEAGGNGAAMRIQPHVWSSSDLEEDYLTDVIANSVCTHGHLRAIVGACFHAKTLAHCLRTGSVPEPQQCQNIADELEEAFLLIESHRSIGSTWIGLWERETGKRLRDEWRATVSELRVTIERATVEADEPREAVSAYETICERLGLEAGHQRGSGILTSVAAVALAWTAPNPHEGLVVAANALGTDTDTIATMAGALFGACDGVDQPPEDVLDRTYLLDEADRLVAVARGNPVSGHSYPDPLSWTAPRTQADALVSNDSRLMVEGLGAVAETDQATSWTPRKNFGWQWVRTDFGQTLLIKRRPELRPLENGNSMAPPAAPADIPLSRRRSRPPSKARHRQGLARRGQGVDIDRAIEYVRQNIENDRVLGYTIREFARRGTLSDLSLLIGKLHDDLQRLPPLPDHRGRPSER